MHITRIIVALMIICVSYMFNGAIKENSRVKKRATNNSFDAVWLVSIIFGILAGLVLCE